MIRPWQTSVPADDPRECFEAEPACRRSAHAASIELGESELHPESVALGDILDKAQALIQAKAAVKGVVLQTDLPPDLPAIRVDRDRAVQVLLNIWTMP